MTSLSNPRGFSSFGRRYGFLVHLSWGSVRGSRAPQAGRGICWTQWLEVRVHEDTASGPSGQQPSLRHGSPRTVLSVAPQAAWPRRSLGSPGRHPGPSPLTCQGSALSWEGEASNLQGRGCAFGVSASGSASSQLLSAPLAAGSEI